ncbi:MAG: hypothetical protein ACYSVY_00195 [Planctomycetota bacterium]|jgi:hypothetical protein
MKGKNQLDPEVLSRVSKLSQKQIAVILRRIPAWALPLDVTESNAASLIEMVDAHMPWDWRSGDGEEVR